MDLPPTWALEEFQPISEILMDPIRPTDRVLEKSDFMEALKASVDEVKEVWRRYQKDQMSRRLPYPTTSQVDSDSDTPPPAQVDLATSVFYCPGCGTNTPQAPSSSTHAT